MIVFKNIQWKNFLSTGNQYTSIQLNKKPNTLIVGSNGAGKSTILDALCFGLFGKAFRKINKPQLVNSVNNKDCKVKIDFDIGKTRYSVVRGIKPAVFEIYKNDKLIPQDSKALDYQSILEQQILKLNYKTFTQVVILGSSSFVPFMQLNARDRREIIEDLLDIQIFGTMSELLKDRIAATKETLRVIDTNIEILNEKIALREKYRKSIEDDRKNRIEELKEDIRKEVAEIEFDNTCIDDANNEKGQIQDTINDEEEVKKTQKKLITYERKIDSKIQRLQSEIEFFDKNDNCPTCNQHISETSKEENIRRIQSELYTLMVVKKKLDLELAEVNRRLTSIEKSKDAISAINDAIKECDIRKSNRQTYITKIKTKIRELESNKELSFGDNFDERLEKELKEKAEITDEYDYMRIASDLLKDSGIKAKIIEKYLPLVNKLINKNLKILDFFVNFNLDENFNETIKSRYRDEFTYTSFSEGEKFRIDISLLLTWREIARLKNSVSTNLLMMDEVFDSSLDSTGTEEFLKMLHSIGGNNNIFVISHKGDIIADKFDEIMTFEKDKNFSKVKVG